MKGHSRGRPATDLQNYSDTRMLHVCPIIYMQPSLGARHFALAQAICRHLCSKPRARELTAAVAATTAIMGGKWQKGKDRKRKDRAAEQERQKARRRAAGGRPGRKDDKRPGRKYIKRKESGRAAETKQQGDRRRFSAAKKQAKKQEVQYLTPSHRSAPAPPQCYRPAAAPKAEAEKQRRAAAAAKAEAAAPKAEAKTEVAAPEASWQSTGEQQQLLRRSPRSSGQQLQHQQQLSKGPRSSDQQQKQPHALTLLRKSQERKKVDEANWAARKAAKLARRRKGLRPKPGDDLVSSE